MLKDLIKEIFIKNKKKIKQIRRLKQKIMLLLKTLKRLIFKELFNIY